MKYILKCWLLVSLFLMVNIANAEDSLSLLMQHLQSKTAIKMAYKETRSLELMDQVWEGSGYLYSMPPDIMIREQLHPQRLLMGVKGEKMFYFDPDNDTRYQDELEASNVLSLNIAVFKALVNADEALLNSLYDIDFSSDAEGWLMALKPKQTLDSELSIIVSGLTNKQANSISFTQDGDVSKFSLQKNDEGENIEIIINQLYQELQGE